MMSFMPRKTILCLCAVWLLAPGVALAQVVADTQFFSNMSDVPLMQGLSEIPARDSAFDKPEGRIVESSAVAAKGVDAAAIAAFYDATLPQLGWARAGAGTYTRKDEILTLKIAREKGVAVARFMIAPK